MKMFTKSFLLSFATNVCSNAQDHPFPPANPNHPKSDQEFLGVNIILTNETPIVVLDLPRNLHRLPPNRPRPTPQPPSVTPSSIHKPCH